MPSVVPMAARMFGNSPESKQVHMKSYLAKAISLIRSRSCTHADIFKKAACLLRLFAKGRRNNGVLYVLFLWPFFPQWFFLPVCREAHGLDVYYREICQQLLQVAFHVIVRGYDINKPKSCLHEFADCRGTAGLM